MPDQLDPHDTGETTDVDDTHDEMDDQMDDDDGVADEAFPDLDGAGASDDVQMFGGDGALERIRRLVAPLVRDLRLDLYDIEFRGGTLRVTIDTPPGSPGGVDLEAITLATRMISRDLDHADLIAGRYTLEVTSPGLERTLRTPAHYQREIGKTVALRLREVGSGERRLTGVLVAADSVAATLRIEEPVRDLGTERRIAYDQIDRARTVFVWGPAPKPGKGPKPGARSAPGTKAASSAARRPSGDASPTSPTSSTSPTTSTQEAT